MSRGGGAREGRWGHVSPDECIGAALSFEVGPGGRPNRWTSSIDGPARTHGVRVRARAGDPDAMRLVCPLWARFGLRTSARLTQEVVRACPGDPRVDSADMGDSWDGEVRAEERCPQQTERTLCLIMDGFGARACSVSLDGLTTGVQRSTHSEAVRTGSVQFPPTSAFELGGSITGCRR